MGFLLNRKKKDKIIAIFDIGSGSVGGAIVRIPLNKKDKPYIVKSVRNNINYFSEKVDTNIFTKNMLKALKLSVNEIYNKKVGAPSEIICVLSSPWYILETKTIKINKESPFIFTEKIAEGLINKELKKTQADHQQKSKYSKLEIIENHIMNVSLNGYRVELPLGMFTKSVEMNTITIFSHKSFLEKINNVILKTFHKTPVSFSSFIINSYFSVRDKYINSDSYLLLDIGGEITEVGIVYKGILKSVLSFPFGKKTFLKYISTKAEIDERDTKELFKLYNSGDLLKEKIKKVDPLFKSAASSWSESFRQCIAKLPYVLALPSTVFLTADLDIIDYFSDVISNEKFIESMTIEHKCNVIPLRGLVFSDMCKISEDDLCDPFLMIEAISISKKIFK